MEIHYVVICRMKNPKDPETQKKRLALRSAHLAGMEFLQQSGTILIGGMISDEDGNPAGSAGIWNVESQQEMERIVKNDVWATEGVWQEFEFIPLRVAKHYLK